MRIFNKTIWSKEEPINKNDIWFDGTAFRIYKEGEWQAITSYNGEGGFTAPPDMNSDFNNDF